jgi:hypothetical protein
MKSGIVQSVLSAPTVLKHLPYKERFQMKRAKSKDKRYATSVWSKNQKLQAVSTYLMLGNMAETAVVTGIPLITLKVWKTSEWFKEYSLALQTEEVQQMDSNMKRVVDKALKAVEDRIDFGDAQFDQKTGKITRVPVKAHVALKITTDLLARQDKIKSQPVREELEKTIDDRLLRLAQEFASFSKPKVIDVQAVEVVQA